MKIEEVIAMSGYELSVIIAKHCGWTKIKHEFIDEPHGRHPLDANKRCWTYCRIPYYTHDLNAMHEAEMKLTEKQFSDYVLNLLCVLDCTYKNAKNKDFPPNRTVMCAPARQRAQAFVLTIGEKNERRV